jgi:hypothetical protein
VNDAIIISASVADAVSTVNVEHNCPTCVERNPIVGPHPAARVVWTCGIGIAKAEVLVGRFSPDPADRDLIGRTTGRVAVDQAFNVKGTTEAAQSAVIRREFPAHLADK